MRFLGRKNLLLAAAGALASVGILHIFSHPQSLPVDKHKTAATAAFTEIDSSTINSNPSYQELTFFKFPSYELPPEFDSPTFSARLVEFQKLPLDRQLAYLNNPVFSSQDKAFLLKVVGDKSLNPTARNEAADLLRTPMFRDGAQWRLYAAMVEDRGEQVINRNYAIQYLANTYVFAADQAAVAQKLYEYSKLPEDSLGATALLQSINLYHNGKLKKLRPGFAAAAAQLAADARYALDDRITAICLLAETAEEKHLPLLREFAGCREV